jgi:Peptidase family M1 domain
LAFVLVTLVPSPAFAQQSLTPVVASGISPVSYDDRYAEVMGLAGDRGQVAEVNNLVLTRDAARFTLASGRLYFLTPVGGRTIGAVFQGQGSFAFTPPSTMERDRLVRFEKTDSLDVPVSSFVFLFTDTTLVELQSKLTVNPSLQPGDLHARIKTALDDLADQDSRSFHPDLMADFLNGDASGLFYAQVIRSGGGPLMFMINPNEVEGVTLRAKVSRRGWGRRPEIICRFPARGQVRGRWTKGDRSRQADIQKYTLDVSLPPTGVGELAFSAQAKLEIVADTAVGPWVVFDLFEKLKVDSARWEGGELATVFRGKDSDLLWVRLDRQIRPGDVRTLNLYYRGDLIDRYGDFFLIKSSAAWYPRSLEGRSLAHFDLTFNTGESYRLASVGDRVDSSKAGRTVRTRWVTQGPIRNASFNLGLFGDYTVKQSGAPAVTVMMSEEAHRKFGGVQQSKMRETVGEDVSKSLLFFQNMYGPAPALHFYATETPTFDGEAFPGMIALSWATFTRTDDRGDDEVFRAHEVAHQWWGIGVDFLSYHDQWLSEGFADFSGLWYLQTARHDNKRYFDILHRWRDGILMRKQEPGPIALGYRVASVKDEDVDDYQTVVYHKGAWTLHMLRLLMIDLKTMNEDRFRETMQDYYRTYAGGRASTEDFRKVVERHIGSDMKWFFDQWVYSAAIPTYRVSYRTQPAEGGQFRVRLRVVQENVPADFQMYVPVTLDLGKDRVARLRVKVRGPRSEIDLPLMPAEPKNVRFNDLDGVLAEVKTVAWQD